MAIQSFARSEIERFFRQGKVPSREGWTSVSRVAARKLDAVDFASVLSDLRAPPGNRLEAPKGDLAGFHSIRVNDQWRVVFRWTETGAEEVDIVDYHS